MIGRVAPACGLVVASCLALSAGPALAHVGGDHAGGLATGFLHPFTGWDHAVAMIAVGLWAAQLGGTARWSLPASFLAAMAAGGALGGLGVVLPAVETGIALSMLALGIAIVAAARPAAWLGTALVAAFAIFHGHAHGTEMPVGAGLALYGPGFLLGSAALHMAGLGIGGLAARLSPDLALRTLGAAIAATGAALLAI